MPLWCRFKQMNDPTSASGRFGWLLTGAAKECDQIENLRPSTTVRKSRSDPRTTYIEFLPGHLIWDSLQIPDEEKYRLEHPWKEKVFYVE